MTRKPKQAAKGTHKPRKADEIERKIERGEYAHGVTLRDLYGRLTAADVLAVPKFKRENRALAGMLAVLLTDAETRPGVIGKALAADALLDVPLVRLYDALHEVDPAAPDAGDALRMTVERIETKLDNNTAITKDLAEELTTWREWVQKLATDKKDSTPVPKLCAAIQAAIVQLWETFKAQPADCEDTTEPSGWRTHKRTYNECLHLHGNDDIWHGRKLIDYTPNAKALERVIHNAKEKKRKKKTAASATQARRKK